MWVRFLPRAPLDEFEAFWGYVAGLAIWRCYDAFMTDESFGTHRVDSEAVSRPLFIGTFIAGCVVGGFLTMILGLAPSSEVQEYIVEQSQYYPYELHDEPVFTHPYFGLSVTMPSSWGEYVVREYYRGPDTVIAIGLPLESEEAISAMPYPESRAGVFEVAHFKVTPAAFWESEEGMCGDEEMCFENEIIASSTSFVVSTYYPRPYAGWDFAAEYGQSEPYVASVKDDLDVETALEVFEIVR